MPPHYRDQVEELTRRYAPLRHFDNAGLTDDLGLTDYLADRLAIAGTVEECVQRIKNLEAMGVEQLFFYAALPDNQRLFEHLVEGVIPEVGE